MVFEIPETTTNLIVGRDFEAGLRFDSDQISRRHAELTMRDGTLWMRDLDSRNGTYCSDKKLNPGQWTEVPAGVLVRFGNSLEASFFLPDPSARPPELVAANGQRVSVPEDGFTIGIGRDPANLLCLVGGGVSRNHAEVRWKGGLLWVQDLGSANGTRRDGRAVGSSWEPVFPGQRLQFGQTNVEVVGRSRDYGTHYEPVPEQLRRSLSLEIMAPFYRRLATLLAAGVNLSRAFESLGDSGEADLDRLVETLHQGVSSGFSLSQSMRRRPDIFGPLALGLVAAGEETGRLTYALSRLADASEQALRLKKMVIAALTYPVILACSLLLLALLFATFICSQDANLFGADQLPWPTRVLVAFGGLARNPLVVSGAILLLGMVAATARQTYQRSRAIRRRVHEAILRMPLVGRLVAKMISARVVYVMGLTLDVGLPLTASLDLGERVAGNLAVEGQLRRVRQAVGLGEDVTAAFGSLEVLPPMVISIIEVGMTTGNLSELLMRASTSLEEDAQDALLALARLLEPILLAGGGVVAGFVALAALAPMLQLLQQL